MVVVIAMNMKEVYCIQQAAGHGGLERLGYYGCRKPEHEGVYCILQAAGHGGLERLGYYGCRKPEKECVYCWRGQLSTIHM